MIRYLNLLLYFFFGEVIEEVGIYLYGESHTGDLDLITRDTESHRVRVITDQL